MYIVRWLIGHPMIAVWVLGALAILLSYTSGDKGASQTVTNEQSSTGVISDQAVNEGNDSALLENKTQELIVKSDDIKKEKKLNSDNTNRVNDKPKNKTETPKNTEITKDKVEVENNTVVDQKTDKDSALVALSQRGQAKNTSLSKDNEAVMDLDQSSSDELLKMAREAYWNNGLDEAAQIYQQLIKLEPNVLEHKGELGNVLWRQGYPKKAAELYSEISIPMIEGGNADRVANMIGFIGLFYPDRASVIHDRMQRLDNEGQKK